MAEEHIVNLDYLNSMAGGNNEIIIEMIELFKQQIPEFVTEMNALYDKKEWASLGALAHKAKSSIAIMGMESLAGELKELEIKAKSGEDPDSYYGYIQNFQEQTSRAVAELDEIVKTLT